jgi:hypothetical protein
MSSFASSHSGTSQRSFDTVLDVEIVDLRLFDFALPKNMAKFEVTYLEVNLKMTVPAYSNLDEDTKKEERIVLRPEQLKKIHIRCKGYETSPIHLGDPPWSVEIQVGVLSTDAEVELLATTEAAIPAGSGADVRADVEGYARLHTTTLDNFERNEIDFRPLHHPVVE